MRCSRESHREKDEELSDALKAAVSDATIAAVSPTGAIPATDKEMGAQYFGDIR